MTRRLLVTAASFAVLLAACGGEEPATDPTPTPAPTVTSKTPSPTTRATPSPASTEGEVTASIVVSGGEVEGGAQDVEVALGDEVRIEVTSDTDDRVHVHAYELLFDVGPTYGASTTIRFTADIPGQFEIELEDSHLKIADLVVQG